MLDRTRICLTCEHPIHDDCTMPYCPHRKRTEAVRAIGIAAVERALDEAQERKLPPSYIEWLAGADADES